ncbi:ABC transporter ATP-binding protein [Arthrobacter sp. AB6]|uniref:ABC transporter ATP-binding protein n=1 Tax=Arthrobacter sp. AB6 TaxID=2962570 RepID=UPI002881587C|nr:ABC transporter ATP-binding protein [Arthrobacter sp. AB6]MDT0196477.1 ABC transporter ATP-binding protein [Arthrobacter sp. AB6]
MTAQQGLGATLQGDQGRGADLYMKFSDVGLRYSGQGPEILGGIDLDVRRGEVVCLLGASGCGKSTLLNIAAGFLVPSKGKVTVGGAPIAGPGADRVMVFQEEAIFPWYTVRQNVEYGLRVRGESASERRAKAARAIELVGLTAYADAYPRQLSGGMRKRCDMARAIVVEPEALLMDEPFAALDVMTKERLQIQFREICRGRDVTSLFVTHDLEEALFVGSKVAVLRKGPGPFLALVDVPFGPDRDPAIKTSPEFQALRRELSSYIEDDPANTKEAA